MREMVADFLLFFLVNFVQKLEFVDIRSLKKMRNGKLWYNKLNLFFKGTM